MRALILSALCVYARAEGAADAETGAPVENALSALKIDSAEWQKELQGWQTANSNTLEKIFSCTVCDSIIENIYGEVLADVAKGKQANAQAAIDRMVNPTPANPGCADWDGYTQQFRELTRYDLSTQGTSFASKFQNINIKQLPHKVYGHVKAEMCHKPCGEHGPRFPEFSDNDCGKCMEVVRDMSLVWTRTQTQDKNAAWRLLGDVCKDMEMRHPAHAIQGDLQSSCEEFVEEHDKMLVGMLVASAPLLKTTMPLETQGYLTEAVCVKALEVCWPREVNQELKRFSSEGQELFKIGRKGHVEGPGHTEL